MSAQENFRASISRITLLEPNPGGLTPSVTSPSLLPKTGSADGVATQRFAEIMNAGRRAGRVNAAAPLPGAGPATSPPVASSQAASLSVPGASSVFRSAAAQHVALAGTPPRDADAVRQRFIDTMNSAQKLERGNARTASPSGRGTATTAAETGIGAGAVDVDDADEPDKPAGLKGGISSLFGKISAMHADLDKRIVDPASYSSAASMIKLQRMTGMYSIYFETLSKAVFKVVRDADTFMKSSA
jgi:hypothetical protein